MTLTELANALGISRWAAHRMVKNQEVKKYYPGTKTARYSLEEVKESIKEGKLKPR